MIPLTGVPEITQHSERKELILTVSCKHLYTLHHKTLLCVNVYNDYSNVLWECLITPLLYMEILKKWRALGCYAAMHHYCGLWTSWVQLAGTCILHESEHRPTQGQENLTPLPHNICGSVGVCVDVCVFTCVCLQQGCVSLMFVWVCMLCFFSGLLSELIDRSEH